MTENNQMRQYDFVEGTEFSGLTGKAIDKAPATVGNSDVVVSGFRGWNGAASLEVADIESFYEDSPGPGPEPSPVPDKPEENPNTDDQDTTANNVVDQITEQSGGTVNVVVPEGQTLNNMTIPSTSNATPKITAEVQDGATIENDSPKNMTLTATNTGDPISVVIVNAPATGSTSVGTTLNGNFKDVYIEGNKLTASTVNGQVAMVPVDENNAMQVSAGWQDGSSLVSDADGKITVTNTNSANEPSVEINTPNATVVMTGGQYDELTVTCADNTLEISGAFHAKKLIMKKGAVIFGASKIEDLVDELVTEGEVTPVTYEISNASIAGLSKNGISNVIEDVVSNSRVGFGIFANGSYRYNLNGHSLSLKGGTAAAMYFRGTPTIDIYGPGKIVESSGVYGIWTGAEGVKVNIYDADVEAYTHVLYAYLGEINVYGGTFKMLGENTDLDEKGHYKFLLNCYDANYTARTARINVYGGKFYNFDPSDAYGEPGAPVSYIDKANYESVKSIEDGVEVFTVVPKNHE